MPGRSFTFDDDLGMDEATLDADQQIGAAGEGPRLAVVLQQQRAGVL
ncbi:MAG: hypothetical protein V9H69_26680 [Anaerolineae bacterium]